MEVVSPIRYWILWILKQYTVILQIITTVGNAMVGLMDAIMQGSGKRKTESKKYL